MKINEAALARLKGGQCSSEVIAYMMDTLQKQMDLLNSASGSVSLGFGDPADQVEPGDLIPVITLSLQPCSHP